MMELMLLPLVSTLAVGGAFLYPSGPSTPLPSGVDTSSEAIRVPSFPYWGQSVRKIWVSQHGILTLDGDNADPGPGLLPFATSSHNEGKLIALFWADHGALGNDVSYYTSTDAALLTRASNDVATYFPCEASFTPTNVFVATWDGVWRNENHDGYSTSYYCYTNTFTHPYHYTVYDTTYITYKITYIYCYSYTYIDQFCTDATSMTYYQCRDYLIYTCSTYYYTYHSYNTTTYTTWYTTTTTTSHCHTSLTYAPSNSYQVILLTDRSRTFAFLYYEHLQWYFVDGAYAVAGFNRGDGVNSLIIPGSGTSQMFYLSSASNVGLDGLFAFRVDNAPHDTPCSGCECHLAGTLVTFSLAVVDPVSGRGKQQVILVERSDVVDACRFRLQPIVKLEDGHVEVKRVIFRFGLHNNPDKYPTRLTLKTDGEKFKVGDVETPLTFPVHEFTDPDGTHIKVQRTGLAYHVTSDTCGWSFDYDPVADTVDYIGSPVVTTGLCGSCV